MLCRPPIYEGETLLRAVSLATGANDGQTLLDEAVVARLPETLVSQLQPAAASDTDGVRAWMVACTQAPGTPRAAPLWLNLRSPDGRVNMTFTPGRPIRIGRDPRADVVLRTAVFSRQHVVIAWRHGYYTLSDTSRNGTWLQTGLTGAVMRISHDMGLLGGAGSLRLGREPQACRPPDLLFSVTPPPAGHDPALDPSGSSESFASTGPFA